MITMRNGTKYYRENELSKLGYIKKEELKDKIKNLSHKWELKIITKYSINTPRDLYIVDFTKEILELIDKC